MKLVTVFAIALFAASCSSQTRSNAEVFTSAQIHSRLKQLAATAAATRSGGSTLGNYGTHAIKLSERTASGGAEIHAHFDDVMIVLEGKATLVTGGEVVDPHTAGNGETTGTALRSGVRQSIAAGDVVHIPAGTPHQLIIPKGTTYSALVIKVKE